MEKILEVLKVILLACIFVAVSIPLVGGGLSELSILQYRLVHVAELDRNTKELQETQDNLLKQERYAKIIKSELNRCRNLASIERTKEKK